jgi:hypothetical protein
MPVDIDLKYDGQQQEWLWWKFYTKKYWLGYLWLPQSQNMISLYLSRLRQSKAAQDFLIWDSSIFEWLNQLVNWLNYCIETIQEAADWEA